MTAEDFRLLCWYTGKYVRRAFHGILLPSSSGSCWTAWP